MSQKLINILRFPFQERGYNNQAYSRIDLLAMLRKESESNDVMMQLKEFSNVHNSDRTSNATRSNLAYKIV